MRAYMKSSRISWLESSVLPQTAPCNGRVMEGVPGGRSFDGFRPVQTQGGVHGRGDICPVVRSLQVPTCLDDFGADFVGLSDHSAAFDASAGKQAGQGVLVIVASLHGIEFSRSPSEFAEAERLGFHRAMCVHRHVSDPSGRRVVRKAQYRFLEI